MIESGQISSMCDVEFLPRPLPLPPLAYTYRRRDSQSNIVAIFCNGYAQSMRDNRLAMEVENFLDHYYPFIQFVSFLLHFIDYENVMIIYKFYEFIGMISIF